MSMTISDSATKAASTHPLAHTIIAYGLVAIGLFLPISTALTNVFFVLVACGVWYVYGSQAIWHHLKDHPFALYCFGFWILFSVGTLYSEADAWLTLRYWFKQHKFLLAPLFMLLCFDRLWRHKLIEAFLVSMTLVLFLAYAKAFHIIDIYGYLTGNAVVFKNHIHLGFLLVLYIWLQFIYMWQMKSAVWLRALLILLTLIFILCFSTGRTGYVLLLLILSFGGFQLYRWRGFIVLLLVSLSCLLLAYHTSSHVHDRMNQALSDVNLYTKQDKYDTDVGLRLHYWDIGIDIVKAKPWLGSGTGSVQHQYQRYNHLSDHITKNPHNEYLNVAIQLGGLGLCYLLLMWLHLFFLAGNMPCVERLVAQGMLLLVTCNSLFNSSLSDTTEGHAYTLFLACAFAGYKGRQKGFRAASD